MGLPLGKLDVDGDDVGVVEAGGDVDGVDEGDSTATGLLVADMAGAGVLEEAGFVDTLKDMHPFSGKSSLMQRPLMNSI